MNAKNLAIGVMLSLVLWPGAAAKAQTTQDPSVAKDDSAVQAPAEPASKKPAAGSLEEALEQALKHNPEIRLKEHAVRTAELELSVMQQRIAARISETQADYAGTFAILQEVQKRLAKLIELTAMRRGIVSDIEIGDAQVSVAKYGGEEKKKKAELASLTGAAINDPVPGSVEGAVDSALKNNPEIRLKSHAVRTAQLELNVIKQQVLGKTAVCYADLLLTRAIYEEVAKRLDKMTVLRAKGNAISEVDLEDANVSVVKYKGEVRRKEAELAALTGKTAVTMPPISSASILKTYVVNGGAEAMAKALQNIFPQTSAVRMTAIGKTQIMVYAPPEIHPQIAKHLEDRQQAPHFEDLLQQAQFQAIANPDVVKFALDLKVDFQFQGSSISKVVEHYQQKIRKAGIKGINLVVNARGGEGVNLELDQPITLAAALQLLEDRHAIRFIFRDYGIACVDAKSIPPGAILVSDFVRLFRGKGPA